MSKRNNITYVKPQEPSFLAKLKAEIGYKEGPTLETKRQRLERDPEDNDSDSGEERQDEQPQVVVLNVGDLTAEEALEEKRLAAKELAEKRADLSQPIVFKQRVKQVNVETATSSKKSERSEKSKSKSKKSKAVASSKLSFNEDEDDEAEDSS
ncbi:uncharacterized protein KIAA1143 homolog [Drosophila bipectinata]|uniref:uncharacterized protein KIAA1143 homolog n=1 Tax=Drosophila bipectinata TaxID=42026 RepID=UPI001C89A076|nr:uncharacterized protein KIAA1143 homolog [Drosophila bipectinata]